MLNFDCIEGAVSAKGFVIYEWKTLFLYSAYLLWFKYRIQCQTLPVV